MARSVAARRRPRGLPVLAEPTRTRLALRRLIGEDPKGARTVITARLTERCWRVWRSDLAPAGMSKSAFRAIVAADWAETWFWVMGDRTWEDLSAGLAGRVLRRLP